MKESDAVRLFLRYIHHIILRNTLKNKVLQFFLTVQNLYHR